MGLGGIHPAVSQKNRKRPQKTNPSCRIRRVAHTLPDMTLADARTAIIAALGRMNAAYASTVFDEWVLVSLRPERGAILAYQGPRAESYKRQFTLDLASMLAEMSGHKLVVGDFLFAAEAHGTHYDACLRLGETSYLFCNRTNGTMNDIRLSSRWREAQIPFAALSEKFRADPLE